MRRGVQLVVAAGVFPTAVHAVSQGTTKEPAQKVQLHKAIKSIYFSLKLVGVVLRYQGWSNGGCIE